MSGALGGRELAFRGPALTACGLSRHQHESAWRPGMRCPARLSAHTHRLSLRDSLRGGGTFPVSQTPTRGGVGCRFHEGSLGAPPPPRQQPPWPPSVCSPGPRPACQGSFHTWGGWW